jgi:hypothetical protein
MGTPKDALYSRSAIVSIKLLTSTGIPFSCPNNSLEINPSSLSFVDVGVAAA